MWSTDGENLIAPRRCSPGPGRQVKSGRPSSARFTLPEEPAELVAADLVLELVVERARLEQLEERRADVGAREHASRLDLLAGLEHDAGGPAAAHDDARHRRLGADLGAQRAGRRGDRLADAAGAAARDAPRAERAVDLAHVVVQQDVRRARASGRPGTCR